MYVLLSCVWQDGGYYMFLTAAEHTDMHSKALGIYYSLQVDPTFCFLRFGSFNKVHETPENIQSGQRLHRAALRRI